MFKKFIPNDPMRLINTLSLPLLAVLFVLQFFNYIPGIVFAAYMVCQAVYQIMYNCLLKAEHKHVYEKSQYLQELIYLKTTIYTAQPLSNDFIKFMETIGNPVKMGFHPNILDEKTFTLQSAEISCYHFEKNTYNLLLSEPDLLQRYEQFVRAEKFKLLNASRHDCFSNLHSDDFEEVPNV